LRESGREKRQNERGKSPREKEEKGEKEGLAKRFPQGEKNKKGEGRGESFSGMKREKGEKSQCANKFLGPPKKKGKEN